MEAPLQKLGTNLERCEWGRVRNGLVGHDVGLHFEITAARGRLGDDHFEEVRRHRHVILAYDLHRPRAARSVPKSKQLAVN